MPPTNGIEVPFLNRRQLDFDTSATFSLIINVGSASNCTVVVRGYTKAGPFSFALTHTGSDDVAEFTRSIPDVPIAISATLNPASSVRANIFTSIHLGMNDDRMVMLTSGFISAVYGISWPQQINPTNIQQGGLPEVVGIADGDTGIQTDISAPANQIWEVLQLTFRCVTTATVGDRFVGVLFNDGVETQFARYSSTAQAASTTRDYTFIQDGINASYTSVDFQPYIETPLPGRLTIPPGTGFRIVSRTDIDADAISRAFILIKRHWLSP